MHTELYGLSVDFSIAMIVSPLTLGSDSRGNWMMPEGRQSTQDTRQAWLQDKYRTLARTGQVQDKYRASTGQLQDNYRTSTGQVQDNYTTTIVLQSSLPPL